MNSIESKNVRNTNPSHGALLFAAAGALLFLIEFHITTTVVDAFLAPATASFKNYKRNVASGRVSWNIVLQQQASSATTSTASSSSKAEPICFHPIDYSAANEYIGADYQHIFADDCYFERGAPSSSFDKDHHAAKHHHHHPREPIYNGRDGVMMFPPPTTGNDSTMEDGKAQDPAAIQRRPASLDRDGFTLLQAPTNVTDWNDLQQIQSIYWSELQDLISNKLFAGEKEDLQHVVIWNPMLRGENQSITNAERNMTTGNPIPTSPTAGLVHIDQDVGAHSLWSLLGLIQNNRLLHHQDAQQFADMETAIQNGCRFAILNFWRNAGSQPIRRQPLAVYSPYYDTNEHDKKDRGRHNNINNDYQYFPNAKPDPDKSCWYTFPEMTPDEVLVFKQYDRDGSYPSDIWHCALKSILDDSAPLRQSFDIRALVVFSTNVDEGQPQQKTSSFNKNHNSRDRFTGHRTRPVLNLEESGAFCDQQAAQRKRDDNKVDAEIVGANGRIGSLFSRRTNAKDGNNNMRAVPRGVCPGCLSLPGTPIIVATPAKAWPQIVEDTIPERRSDLVWIGNGLPPTTKTVTDDDDEDTTVVVPHFGVLQANGRPLTSPESPPTYLYGKHAKVVAAWLKDNAPLLQLELVESYADILKLAARKLLWAASMWLLCHDNKDNTPKTALQVHQERRNDLEALVCQELYPALCSRLAAMKSSKTDTTCTNVDDDGDGCAAAMEYLLQYSKSMPTAIPNLELARLEWQERNAFFLAARAIIPQSFHQELLQRVGGISESEMDVTVSKLLNSSGDKKQQEREGDRVAPVTNTKTNRTKEAIHVPALQMSFIGTRVLHQKIPRSVIVVGNGILGSSVALHLARQGVTNVTVVDMQASTDALGNTTPASWAWLNANGKSPPAYAWLNQLGLDGWRRDPVIRHLPKWSGSLVRFDKEQCMLGGYRHEGPLDKNRVQELEPLADLADDGDGSDDQKTYTYYYPDEGLIDPSRAVATLRREAAALGVRFLSNMNVTGFTKRDGSVSGIEVVKGHGEEKLPTRIAMAADAVVVAAGIGSAELGKLPLLYRPGQIAFALPIKNKDDADSRKLQRILVDTVRESHVLQRDDGTLVIGGGALEIGGDGAVALETKGCSHENSGVSANDALLATAKRVVPGVIGDFSHTEQALRPIPEDGLPVMCFVEPGLYAMVSHSGMTLSPVLGALAAAELAEGVSVEVLDQFRPSRFFKS